MPYADLDNLIADYIPEATNAEEIASVGRILDSVSAFVDAYTSRPPAFFLPSPLVAVARRVRGEGMDYLRLPVHVLGSISAIGDTDFSEFSSVLYESEKSGWLYFETVGSQSADFNSDLSQPEWSYERRRFTDGFNYKITARWGYAAVPLPVAEAVRLITARIWQTQRGTIGQITSDGFIHEKLIPQAARDLLQPFIKREFEI